MSAPTVDLPPVTSRPSSHAARRQRGPLVLLVLVSLALVGAAFGTSLALINRSTPDQPAAAVGAPGAATEQQVLSGQDATRTATQEAATQAPRDVAVEPSRPVLADGRHQVYISKVDAGRDRVVVDLIQVFNDKAAVDAAIADGKSREEAQYLSTWIRNDNPRLRTLALAGDLKVEFWNYCEAGGNDRRAILDQLADHARTGAHYYTLTVAGGAVHSIQERQALNAC